MKAYKIVSLQKLVKLLVLVIVVISLSGCSSYLMCKKQNVNEYLRTISAYGGLSNGGFTDNDRSSLIEADRKSNRNLIGFHTEWSFYRNALEVGVDYHTFEQEIKYSDNELGVNGTRNLKFKQFRVPITYNILLLPYGDNYNYLDLKLGILMAINSEKDVEDVKANNLPDAVWSGYTIGYHIGMASAPIHINGNLRLGGFWDFTYGGKIYQDTYHNSSSTGVQRDFSFGIVLKCDL